MGDLGSKKGNLRQRAVVRKIGILMPSVFALDKA